MGSVASGRGLISWPTLIGRYTGNGSAEIESAAWCGSQQVSSSSTFSAPETGWSRWWSHTPAHCSASCLSLPVEECGKAGSSWSTTISPQEVVLTSVTGWTNTWQDEQRITMERVTDFLLGQMLWFYQPSGPWPDGLYCSVTGPAENKKNPENRKKKPSSSDHSSEAGRQTRPLNQNQSQHTVEPTGL